MNLQKKSLKIKKIQFLEKSKKRKCFDFVGKNMNVSMFFVYFRIFFKFSNSCVKILFCRHTISLQTSPDRLLSRFGYPDSSLVFSRNIPSLLPPSPLTPPHQSSLTPLTPISSPNLHLIFLKMTILIIFILFPPSFICVYRMV